MWPVVVVSRPSGRILVSVRGADGSLIAMTSATVPEPANTGLVRIEASVEASEIRRVPVDEAVPLAVSTRVRVTVRAAPAGLVATSASAVPSGDLTGARSSPVSRLVGAPAEAPVAAAPRCSTPERVVGPVVP